MSRDTTPNSCALIGWLALRSTIAGLLSIPCQRDSCVSLAFAVVIWIYFGAAIRSGSWRRTRCPLGPSMEAPDLWLRRKGDCAHPQGILTRWCHFVGACSCEPEAMGAFARCARVGVYGIVMMILHSYDGISLPQVIDRFYRILHICCAFGRTISATKRAARMVEPTLTHSYDNRAARISLGVA